MLLSIAKVILFYWEVCKHVAMLIIISNKVYIILYDWKKSFYLIQNLNCNIIKCKSSFCQTNDYNKFYICFSFLKKNVFIALLEFPFYVFTFNFVVK